MANEAENTQNIKIRSAKNVEDREQAGHGWTEEIRVTGMHTSSLVIGKSTDKKVPVGFEGNAFIHKRQMVAPRSPYGSFDRAGRALPGVARSVHRRFGFAPRSIYRRDRPRVVARSAAGFLRRVLRRENNLVTDGTRENRLACCDS